MPDEGAEMPDEGAEMPDEGEIPEEGGEGEMPSDPAEDEGGMETDDISGEMEGADKKIAQLASEYEIEELIKAPSPQNRCYFHDGRTRKNVLWRNARRLKKSD